MEELDQLLENAEPQKKEEKGTKYRRLLSISGTRFIARTRNLRIFHNKLTCIKDALCEMGLESISETLDAKFQATVSTLYAILCPISELSQALQSPVLNLVGAQKHVKMLITYLSQMRTEKAFNDLVQNSKECTNSVSLKNSEDNQMNIQEPEGIIIFKIISQ